jgi:hypothetical protein
MKKFFLLFLICTMTMGGFAQDMKTYQYAERDTLNLYLDFYTPESVNDSTICLVYVFGGGFIGGHRDGEWEKAYFKQLVDAGFMVASIDYRLGLIGAKNIGIFNTDPVEKAIYMATEDAILALAYLLEHANELKINKDYIVMTGSSAGAITSLQTDYAMCNGFLNYDILPEDFRLAGVVAYAGAVFSHEGPVKYRNRAPAPTMMYHGMLDNLVSYKGISLFSVGMFGADALVKCFEKSNYPYFARRFEGYGHSIALAGPLTIDDLLWFCRHYIYNKEKIQVDGTYSNLDPATMPPYDYYSPKDLYK